MRYLLCALLFVCSVFAQDETLAPSKTQGGSFYVDGIVYQYAVGKQYTVVAAAHVVLNRKFLAIKVRVYNAGLAFGDDEAGRRVAARRGQRAHGGCAIGR